ncbi:hypothetical protein J6TS7_32250 [Paenibacillus dendritiformis]|uniref:helix-turn-helix domain-containing protein n=1 Tax=Paenibacillus TaxID=44249 RepID=UPI001B1A4AC6|nr:helix-turn-helix transcriptional regulator [Paenibacillus dendritiformis]GIO79615.1 hypothetical protein J6TS7_32250 [Paenibacillus dendritiformis]
MNFGEYLKRLRRKKGVSQADLAAAAEVDTSYVSKIEKGVSYPSEDLLISFAKTLEVDHVDLILRCGKVPGEFVELILNDDETVGYLKGKLRKDGEYV